MKKNPPHDAPVSDETDSSKQAGRKTHRQSEYLAASEGMVGQPEPDRLLETIVVRAAQLLGTPHGYLYLIDPEKGEVEAKVGLGTFEKRVGIREKLGEGLAGKVWQTCRPLIVDDYDAWPDRAPDFSPGQVRAAVGVPLRSGSEVIGVLGVAHAEPGRTFGEEEAELLDQFAQLASIALDNARLYALARRELAERKEAGEGSGGGAQPAAHLDGQPAGLHLHQRYRESLRSQQRRARQGVGGRKRGRDKRKDGLRLLPGGASGAVLRR